MWYYVLADYNNSLMRAGLLCMHTCICWYGCTYVIVCKYACKCMYAIYRFVCMYKYVWFSVLRDVLVYRYNIYVNIHMYIYIIHVCMCVCMYECMHRSVYMPLFFCDKVSLQLVCKTSFLYVMLFF